MLIIFATLIDLKELYSQTLFYVFQTRDLSRAREILQGKNYFFGPEMTGGGNLPGPLYYYLLSFALLFKNTWLSAWWLQLTLSLVAGGVGFTYFRKTKNEYIALAWFVLFTSAPLTFRFLQVFLNVSSLIPFVVLALVLINISFTSLSEKTRHLSYLLASFVIGLGLQLHYSIVILFIAMNFCFLFSKKLGLQKIQKKIYLLSFVAYFLPSIPYYLWLLTNTSSNTIMGVSTHSGEGTNAIQSLIYLLRFAFYTETDEFLIESLRKILSSIPAFFIIYFITYLIGKFLNTRSKDQTYTLKINYYDFKPLIICMIFSVIPYIDWYLSSQAVRYTMPFYLSLIFMAIFYFDAIRRNDKFLKIFNYVQIIFLIMFSIFIIYFYTKEIYLRFFYYTALIIFSFLILNYFKKLGKAIVLSYVLLCLTSLSQFITKDYTDLKKYHWALFMPQTYEWEHIWTTIHKVTGWDYETARKRIYYVGHHLEQDPGLFLEEFDLNIVKVNQERRNPDGFFVSNRIRLDTNKNLILYDLEYLKILPKLWLRKQNTTQEIFDALDDRDIILGKNISDTIFIVPYWVVDTSKVPKHFHNSGLGYNTSSSQQIFNKIQSNKGVLRIDESTILFKLNECPDHKNYCSNGALVSINQIENAKTNINLNIFGNTLSQTSPWINPNWTQAWVNPQISITCGKKEFNFLISRSIGFTRNGSHQVTSPLLQANNSFVGPFIKDIEIDCPFSKITRIELIRESSVVESIKSTFSLGEERLVYFFKTENK
jgi:hypothetical protein